FRARIQANNESVAQEKERFQTWLQQKHQEEQKIADTVGYFLTDNPVTVGSVLPPNPPAPAAAPLPTKEKS
ncbi:MAG TPA: hypothetical protein VER03_11665, partial [Bryobacteraceae bacterium]|nr:hypothetical protein [Bryobacteraceae bacterium]